MLNWLTCLFCGHDWDYRRQPYSRATIRTCNTCGKVEVETVRYHEERDWCNIKAVKPHVLGPLKKQLRPRVKVHPPKLKITGHQPESRPDHNIKSPPPREL